MGPKNGGFGGKWGVETLDFGFATPKRHFLARNRVVWRILRQNRCTRLGCSLSQEPPKKEKSSRVTRGAKSRMRRTETPKPIWIKFCLVVDIPDVVTYTNFGDHRLRGFWVAGGQISPSSIDFHRRPYNTLALPCERVIYVPQSHWQSPSSSCYGTVVALSILFTYLVLVSVLVLFCADFL